LRRAVKEKEKKNEYKQNNHGFEDMKISVKMKLSALWAAVMFCFIYGDILGFHKPGIIADMMAGKMGPFPVTQESLLIAALFMAIPGVMVFLSPGIEA